jgi:hypothetical protein
MPILSGKFTETIPWKTMRLSLVNSLLPKKGRLVWRYYFSYTYSKRTKQALIWTPIAGAKTLVKKNWRNLQFLSA